MDNNLVNEDVREEENFSILSLNNIKKDYVMGKGIETVHALKGISLKFRKSEFVSILGPSGCGKTTLLNIIGGLDKYTDGDLKINNISTKQYKDKDWDVYRNHHIGFIFQSYNLIPHQNLLSNVELSLTIGGMSKKERIEKAKKALDRVGLANLYYKKPNQLSGGQCQRVAIARALVNEPDILLADEPTGALDSETSIQIMELIKEISKEKLVIMVTHNGELAKQYSTRIISLLDGQVVNDTNPYEGEKVLNQSNFSVVSNKAKMSFWTSFKLSFKNLISKWKRTVLVCIAGSIGIVGVSTVLAVSSGVTGYIESMQDDMLSGNPISIQESSYDLNAMLNAQDNFKKAEIVKENGIVNVNSLVEYLIKQSSQANSYIINNEITKEYVDYVLAMNPEYYADIYLDYGLDLANSMYTTWKYTNDNSLGIQAENISLATITNMYISVLKETSFKQYSSYISQLGKQFDQLPSNKDYVLSQYDVLAGDFAKEKDEIMIVLNKDDQLTDVLLAQLGYYTQEEFLNIIYKATNDNLYKDENYKMKFTYAELLNKKFTWYPNDSIFIKNTNEITSSALPFFYKPYVNDTFKNGVDLKVVGILKPKDDIAYGCLRNGFYYTEALAKYELEQNLNSEIIKYYKDKNMSSITSGAIPVNIEGSTPIIVQSGITYDYHYYYLGTRKDNQVGFLGKESNVSALLSIFGPYLGDSSSTESKASYYTLYLKEIGGNDVASGINIYPTNFEYKNDVTSYLDKWNADGDLIVNGVSIPKSERAQITYTDNLEVIITLIKTMINIVTYALIAFTALSLLVSTVMIGIITYVSVVERTKEIGVIRSIGGRKKDVSHLFNAEAFLIGLVSGIFGIIITLLLSLIINLIVGHLTNIYTLASLKVSSAIIMIIVSILLTSISGMIPAKAAAKRDPVVALRTE